jgi:membrane-bound lytic murein transglycosylase
MKTTKKNTLAFVRQQLATNEAWALKALVRIFKENQTSSEQSMEATTDDNGIGFTGTDGHFLTSLAKQYISRGKLSDKQMVHVMKKMPKYARQVIAFSDTEKLKALVEAA